MTTRSRESIRNAASTLAHYWSEPAEDVMNRIGVERVLLAYPEGQRCLLCAKVLQFLNTRHTPADAEAFEAMLYDASMLGGLL